MARPLLFWLDDIHNASAATIEGLLKIHTDEPDQRIVMVATVRLEDVVMGTATATRLRELRDIMNGKLIDIEPLPADTTATLLRESLPLDDAAVKEAARRSRGNPLFALQQLHAWALAGNMEFQNGVYRVPPEVLGDAAADHGGALGQPRRGHARVAPRWRRMPPPPSGGDIRKNVLSALLNALALPSEAAILSLQTAEILVPRGPGRYAWPHELLQEHLLLTLNERSDKERFYRASATALTQHPLANSRRVIRQRVVNLLQADDADTAALLLFDFLQQSWNGAREPVATLADLELLKGKLTGRTLALKNRWQAEALRHAGRIAEAMTFAELARTRFEELGDPENIAHSLRLQGHLASDQGSSAEGLELTQRAHQMFVEQNKRARPSPMRSRRGRNSVPARQLRRSARGTIQRGERNFATLGQALGRGQCLLLLSWVEHSEGATERSRRLAQEARSEFERAGYRLGTAQADVSIAHVEHRLMNFHSAEIGALDALSTFETLRTPRGQAACDRLLAMIGLDTDDLDMAELHTERASQLFARMSDPWA